MKKIKTDTNLYAYLESVGVLEHGTEAEIKAAKRAYWKSYYARYRKAVRAENPEYSVALSRKNGEYGKIALAARKHHMPVTTFIRTAALAYLDRSYIVPNPDQIARLEQHLMNCLNEVQAIVRVKEKYHWEREQKLDAIAERISRLETEIRAALCFPPEASAT